jgi:hypothetical protein
MLYQETIEASTLELITSLQSKDYLRGFFLVGETALALHLGHRKSVDIDLFSNFDFESSGLLEKLHLDYPYQLYYTATNKLKGSINDIKVDILAHRYIYLQEPISYSGIHVLSEPDIIAMKLNAIATSGQRSKDFIDIYYLLDKYTIGSMLAYFLKKYKQENETFLLKSLIYFDEVDLTDWPVVVKNPDLKWDDVKKQLDKAVLQYVRNPIK